LLDRLEREFVQKIDRIEPNSFFDDILAEKNRQIAELQSLAKNREILDKLKELEKIKASYAYRIVEKTRMLLFAIPQFRWALYLLRKVL